MNKVIYYSILDLDRGLVYQTGRNSTSLDELITTFKHIEEGIGIKNYKRVLKEAGLMVIMTEDLIPIVTGTIK